MTRGMLTTTLKSQPGLARLKFTAYQPNDGDRMVNRVRQCSRSADEIATCREPDMQRKIHITSDMCRCNNDVNSHNATSQLLFFPLGILSGPSKAQSPVSIPHTNPPSQSISTTRQNENIQDPVEAVQKRNEVVLLVVKVRIAREKKQRGNEAKRSETTAERNRRGKEDDDSNAMSACCSHAPKSSRGGK